MLPKGADFVNPDLCLQTIYFVITAMNSAKSSLIESGRMIICLRKAELPNPGILYLSLSGVFFPLPCSGFFL